MRSEVTAGVQGTRWGYGQLAMGAALLLALAGCGATRELGEQGTGRVTGAAEAGTPCTTEGQMQACYTGPAGTEGVGVCRAGSQICQNGAWSPCQSEVTPRQEACNTVDDDCDGQTDEPEDLARTCNTGKLGACAVGAYQCQDGRELCVENQGPKPETCDGVDNDCDGAADEEFPGEGSACTTQGSSACTPAHPGKLTCANGQVHCAASDVPSCDTGEPGTCRQGVQVCVGEHITCVRESSPKPETCDGKDNDCDGTADNAALGDGARCYTGQKGACAIGAMACTNGGLTCVAPAPALEEVCDGIDNNCDGSVDEGDPEGGAACYAVACSGTRTCVAGSLVCVCKGPR